MGFLSNYSVKTTETPSETPTTTPPPILVDMPSKPVNFVFNKDEIAREDNMESKDTNEGLLEGASEVKETKGGFSFTTPSTTKASSGGFSFGGTSSSSSGTFGFNPGSGNSSSTNTSGFNPGTGASLGTGGSVPFSFGGLATSETTTEKPAETTPFSFGTTTKESTINFGSSSTEAKPVSFSFGQVITPKESEKPASVGGFNLGTVPVSSFGFNPGSGSSSANTGFNPGATSVGKGAVPFSFGSRATDNDDSSSDSSSEPPKETPASFSLGVTPKVQPSVGGFSFGNTSSNTSGGFSLIPTSSTPQESPFSLGATAKESTFNFGATTTETKPVSFSFTPSEPKKPMESEKPASVGGFSLGTVPVSSFGFNPGSGSSSANTGFNPGATSVGKGAIPFSFGSRATDNDDSSSDSSSEPEKEAPVSFSFGNTAKEQPASSFTFGFNTSENTTAPLINFPKNPQISKTYEDMEDDEQPMKEITSTPKAIRSKKPPNTVSYVKAGSKFDFKKRVDEEDLLDNDPLVLEEDKFTLNRPMMQTKPTKDSVADLNRTAPIQSSVPFNDSFESSTNGVSPFAKYLEKTTTNDDTIFSISRSPLNSNSPPIQSVYQRSLLPNFSAMEDDADSYNAEHIEYVPNSDSYLSNEELWWKILHESAEMFLYIQDAFSEDKLDKNILEKTISQFKSIIYQGIGVLPSFGAYFDIFSAVDIFYFNRFCRGGLIQKLVKWYIRSSVCLSKGMESDQNIYRLLVIGEHSAKVVEAIRQERSSALSTMPKRLLDLYDTFFEVLSKRPNVINYSSISATFEEYLDEMQVWKRVALKLKKEVQGQDDNSEDFAFLGTCIEIITGNESIITEVSDNWVEVLIGLALYKYQHFADINEIIDLAVHAKNLREDEESNFVLEAICLIVVGDNLEETLKNIDQGLAGSNQETFKFHWFMSHIATFFYHINYLYQRIYSATHTNSYLESLYSFKNESIKSYVIEELLPYYHKLIESNPCENLENDLWKIAVDYLSYYDDESQKQIQEIISNIILNIPITNENQIDKIYRYVKDTPFAKGVCGQLHLNLGLYYISENNFAAGIYHIYKSGNMDELEDVIREKISTTQNLRYVHYGLDEYSFMVEMPEIQWISSFFKILDNCESYAHLLPPTLYEIPNSKLKLELLMSINLTLLQYSELLSVMEHVEYMEFEFKENAEGDMHTKLSTLSELRLLLAQTLQIKILQ